MARSRGFTLIELLVSSVLVGVGLSAAFLGMNRVATTDAYLRDSDRLQRLAVQKLAALRIEGDLRTAETSGDFTEEGYPDAQWSLELQTTDDENVEEAVLTVSQGTVEQSIAERIFFRPETTTGAAGQGTTSP